MTIFIKFVLFIYLKLYIGNFDTAETFWLYY